MKDEMKFWTPDRLIKTGAQYRIAFGPRTGGKTFGVLKHSFARYLEDGSELAIIRRYDEDFVGANSAKFIYNGLMHDAFGVNQISEMSDGLYYGVEYYARNYYLTQVNSEGEIVRTNKIIARAFALTGTEHTKGSTGFPMVKNVLFDEFMATTGYLNDEFTLFLHTLASIIRQRDDVAVWMMGNAITRFCPYFAEMGLKNAKSMKQGDLEVYKFGESKLRVAIECVGADVSKRPSAVYFAFDNPKLAMITQAGMWQLDIYPHLPMKYKPKDVVMEFFVIFDGETLHAEVIESDSGVFIYMHRKTTPLRDPDNDLIYSLDHYDVRPNWNRSIRQYRTKTQKRIYQLVITGKIYFQDNEVGDMFHHYMEKCA